MNPAPPNSSRVSRLKKRFEDVLSGSVKLDSRSATLFLEGLCAQGDPVVCLDAITKSVHGLSSAQSAMRFDLSVEFMNGLGSTTLEYLLRACDVGGNALDNLLFHLVEPPVFWDVFVRTFQQGALSENAQLVFAKVLSRLLTLQNRDTTPYRGIAAQLFIQESLVASSKHEIREIGHLIKHILSNASQVTAACVLNGPGGRHDNDFSDYRDIAILPTADEILCRKPPFLRAEFHNELAASETPIEDYLDNTFRMLREDMLFDIREEVELAPQKSGKQHRSPHIFHNMSMIGVHTDRQSRWGVKLQCNTDFKQLKNIAGQGARVEFLTKNPSGLKIMRHQSLVCLASGQDIIGFGAVNRTEELLACNPPVIVLQLDDVVNIRRTLNALCATKDVRLIQIDAATFSFEPVLTALQKMDSVPLAREILFWSLETPVRAARDREALSLITKMVVSNFSVDLSTLLDLPKSICLDKSQASSLFAGLTKRVSLIQGPPGTGKSFIGTILAKAIHDKTSQTILIVCYTNHALDQFLGDLLSYGIPAESMVRLGGRPSQSMEHLSLRNQPRSRIQYDWDKINERRENASGHENKLRTHFHKLLANHDTDAMDYLKREHREFFNAFHVPPVTEDGMTLVGANGHAIDATYLFSRWTRGLDAGVLSGDSHVRASARIWGMDHSARQQLLATWRQERVAKATESICQAGTGYNAAHDAIKQEFGGSTVAVLRQKRIIACTTTGAAIYTDAIKAAGPEFLLVEEAGEILESHVLTALSHKVDQMILIGDHKQLRPKVNNYQLAVESGEGFNLNRSLFERLVLKGYPHETLSTQHRMRPEISAFVRELTYPELVDAPSTQQRPNVRGVQSNIIFIDHSHSEDDNTLMADRADGGTKSSKQNTYEVEMVLKIVRYLAQQGYKSEDIVVLTPYLGQLQQLRDGLKRDNDLILNDMDSSDLARAGQSEASASPGHKAKKGRIHLATIDNYQGEESDIVVASLTRSNKSNTIGFMDSPERLNVLLSRARNGLILIGNADTFLHSKKGGALWRRFFNLLETGRYVYQGFPVKCERHPERAILLARANDFDQHCPDGGCTDPCGFVLACGHVCPMKCHPRRSASVSSASASVLYDPHDTSRCKYRMHATCRAGCHSIVWQCRSGPPADCTTCVEEVKRLEEIALQMLELQQRREEAEMEHRRRMAELESKLRAQEVARAEKERRVQEVQQWVQEEELVRQEECRRKQEEGRIRQEEQRKKEEEQKRNRDERAKKREERKKKQEVTNQKQGIFQKKKEEKKRKQEENKVKKDLEQQLKRYEAEMGHRRRMAELEAKQRAEEVARAEEERKLQEARRIHEEELIRQEERKKKQEEERVKQVEERKRLEEEERKRQEKEKKRQERKIRQQERKKLEKVEKKKKTEEKKRKREEMKAKKVEEAKRLHESIRQRQEEERRRQGASETDQQGKETEPLQPAACKGEEQGYERRKENEGEQPEPGIELLREATRKRIEQHRVELWAEEWRMADNKRRQQAEGVPAAAQPAKKKARKNKRSGN